MSSRPYISFAEVKQKVSIPDVLQVFGLADHLTRKGDKFSGICPIPTHQHGPCPNPEQFKIDRKDGVWLFHCFSADCGRGGDVIEFVKAMTGYDNTHVRFWFAEKFGDRLTATRTSGKQTGPEAGNKAAGQPANCPPVAANAKAAEPSAPVANEPAPVENPPSEQPNELKPLRFHLRLDPEVAYLKERRVAPETIQRYGLGLCGRGVLKGYVAIPVFLPTQSGDENPVAYLGRWPGEDYDEAAGRPRYRWPEGFPKSRVVYGLREALSTPEGLPLIVVEGPFKVYHLVQAGFGSTVAVMGSSLSDEQAAILQATGRPIVLFFDGDEAGQSGMGSAGARLVRQAFVRAVIVPDGTEPDTLSPEELKNVLSFIPA